MPTGYIIAMTGVLCLSLSYFTPIMISSVRARARVLVVPVCVVIYICQLRILYKSLGMEHNAKNSHNQFCE